MTKTPRTSCILSGSNPRSSRPRFTPPTENYSPSYPTNTPRRVVPQPAPPAGYVFKGGHLFVCQPAFRENNLQGYLYLESDLRYFYERVKIYSAIAALIMFGSVIVALVLANRLQKRISEPIIALANTARIVSERRDYSVRAPKLAPDELGVLTDAFNEMLARIEQNAITGAFLSAIVESSDDAIIGKDLTGKVVSWNAGAERMFGYSAAEIVGTSIERLLAPDRPDEERRILENAKRGETHLYETVRVRKDGKLVDVSLAVSPIRDAHGSIVGVSSIARDITERKRSEEQILQFNAELEHRVQMRTAEFDLRQPGTRSLHLLRRSRFARAAAAHRRLHPHFAGRFRRLFPARSRATAWRPSAAAAKT